MTKKPTKAQLAAAVAEIEAGLSADQIGEVRRGPGRPPLSSASHGKSPTVNVRLNGSLLTLLDAKVATTGATRSEVVREALEAFLGEAPRSRQGKRRAAN